MPLKGRQNFFTGWSSKELELEKSIEARAASWSWSKGNWYKMEQRCGDEIQANSLNEETNYKSMLPKGRQKFFLCVQKSEPEQLVGVKAASWSWSKGRSIRCSKDL